MVSGISLLENFMLTVKHKNVTSQITFPTCSAVFPLGECRNVTGEALEQQSDVGQGQFITETARVPCAPTRGTAVLEDPSAMSQRQPGRSSVGVEGPKIGQAMIGPHS